MTELRTVQYCNVRTSTLRNMYVVRTVLGVRVLPSYRGAKTSRANCEDELNGYVILYVGVTLVLYLYSVPIVHTVRKYLDVLRYLSFSEYIMQLCIYCIRAILPTVYTVYTGIYSL